MIAIAPSRHPPIRRPFRNTERVRDVRKRPVLLEHPNDKQTTLNRSEFGVTVQLHGISLELEASAPPVSKETRTDQRHWELHLDVRLANRRRQDPPSESSRSNTLCTIRTPRVAANRKVEDRVGRRRSRLFAGMAACVVSLVLPGAVPVARADASVTEFSFVSAPGDFIGQGSSQAYSTDNSTIAVSGTTASVHLNASAGSHFWSVDVSAPTPEERCT